MQLHLVISLTVAAALLPASAMADPVFDSPGRGYREQLQRLVPTRQPSPPRVALHSGSRADEVPVAYYASSDRGASARIERILSEAAIGCSLKVGIAPTVFVKPSDCARAKELLEKLPEEGHWSVIVIFEAKSKSKSEPR